MTILLWFAKVDATHTTIWEQFKDVNPNEQLVEINVRQTVFYAPPRRSIKNWFVSPACRGAHAPPRVAADALVNRNVRAGRAVEKETANHANHANASPSPP